MRIEIHFRWSMSKTLFTKMTVWATEAANEHLICTKQKKSWNNANEMNKRCHFNPCHFVPLYFFSLFQHLFKTHNLFFSIFFSVCAKKNNQPFLPLLRQLCPVQYTSSFECNVSNSSFSNMNVFFFKWKCLKKKLYFDFCFECINGNSMKLLLTNVVLSNVHLNLMIFQF